MARDLFVLLMMHPPSPDREFWCGICGAHLRGRTVTLDEAGRATCADCTGRQPECGGGAAAAAPAVACCCHRCQQRRRDASN